MSDRQRDFSPLYGSKRQNQLLGAGVYADNSLGGASATGWGEAITRIVLSKFAFDALTNNQHPSDAACQAIEMLARRVGGTGGIIIADRLERIGFAFNTPRMARAFIVNRMENIVADC